MSEKNAAATTNAEEKATVPAVKTETSIDNILDSVDVSNQVFYVPEQYNHLYKVAQGISASDIIPKHYRQKPANCFIALVRSSRMDIDPFWFMEQTYVVHGKLGIQGKLLIALMNKSGIFKGRVVFDYSGEGETRKCAAQGVLKESGQPVSMECSIALARKNGWTNDTKNKDTGEIILSKWNSLPELMLAYRSASFLGNVYCPDVLGGLTVVEENETFGEEPEQDKGPLLEPRPESEEKPKGQLPPESEKKELPKELKTVDDLAAVLESKEIKRDSFNSYLVAKKSLGEGEDMISLKPEALKRLCKNVNLAIVDFNAWSKKNASN